MHSKEKECKNGKCGHAQPGAGQKKIYLALSPNKGMNSAMTMRKYSSYDRIQDYPFVRCFFP